MIKKKDMHDHYILLTKENMNPLRKFYLQVYLCQILVRGWWQEEEY